MVVDDLDEATILILHRLRFGQELRRIADRRKWIADLVRNRGGQATQRGQGHLLGTPREQRGVIEEDQDMRVVVRRHARKARNHLGHIGRQGNRILINAPGVSPVIEPPGEFRGNLAQVALIGRGIADEVPCRLVDAQDVIGVIDQQHAGFHALDDQIVDLLKVEQVDTALLGQRLGLAHLPAQIGAQRGDREIGETEKACFDNAAIARNSIEQGNKRRHHHADRGKRGQNDRLAERQKQGGNTDIDHQHHRD